MNANGRKNCLKIIKLTLFASVHAKPRFSGQKHRCFRYTAEKWLLGEHLVLIFKSKTQFLSRERLRKINRI